MAKFNGEEWTKISRMTSIDDPQQLLTVYDELEFVALTNGKGKIQLFSGREVFEKTPAPVQVVDTVGAGDAFSAALAAGAMTGAEPAVMLEIACAAGTLAVQHPGAHVQLPEQITTCFN